VIRAGLISIALIGATLSPMARDPADDGFPLSTYPMFASPRDTVQTLNYAIGETAQGERRAIEPRWVGSRQVLQAQAVIERAVLGGRPALIALCRAVIQRAPAEIALVRIVHGTHDAVAFLLDHHVGRELEYVRCTR